MLRSLQSGLVRLAAIMICGLVAITAFSFSGIDMAEAQKKQVKAQKKSAKKANVIKVREARNTKRAKNRNAKSRNNARAAQRQRPARQDGFRDPRFAAIVVDVNTGKVLQSAAPDSARHPASVTKVMTLYLLFEQLEAGNLTLDSRLPVSAFAASQAPSKLGLRAGSTLSVRDAINGLVTRSANDAAVVVAEAIAGSEPRFAQLMTRRARQLGMSRTTFRNASGLPNPEQITTARDLARLGIAIQDRFPRQFRYFSTRVFKFRGQNIANHNRLLGRVEGVDGIKTGYTRASGFNLLTSVNDGDRRLVAVVLGGRTGASRDRTMASLVERNLRRAYAGNRQTRTYARAPSDDTVALAAGTERPRARPAVVGEGATVRNSAPVARNAEQVAFADVPLPTPRPTAAPRAAARADRPAEPALRWVEGADPITTSSTGAVTAAATTDTPGAARRVETRTIRVAETGAIAEPSTAPARTELAAAAPEGERQGWIIQIGATDSETSARRLLGKAAGIDAVASAKPFTETVERNGATLWRARFAGFDGRGDAQAACAALKRERFQCIAVRL